MSGHLLQQRLGGGDVVRNRLVQREHMESVAVRPVTGNGARARVSPVSQTARDELHSRSTRLTRAGVDILHAGLDHRDGVQQRARQRNVDVVDDEHQLPGFWREPGPAQLRGSIFTNTLSRPRRRHHAAIAELGAGDRDAIGRCETRAGKRASMLAGAHSAQQSADGAHHAPLPAPRIATVLDRSTSPNSAGRYPGAASRGNTPPLAMMSRMRSGSLATDPDAPVVSLRHSPALRPKVPVSPSWNAVVASG